MAALPPLFRLDALRASAAAPAGLSAPAAPAVAPRAARLVACPGAAPRVLLRAPRGGALVLLHAVARDDARGGAAVFALYRSDGLMRVGRVAAGSAGAGAAGGGGAWRDVPWCEGALDGRGALALCRVTAKTHALHGEMTVVATRPLAAGAVLCVYGGEVLRAAEAAARAADAAAPVTHYDMEAATGGPLFDFTTRGYHLRSIGAAFNDPKGVAGASANVAFSAVVVAGLPFQVGLAKAAVGTAQELFFSYGPGARAGFAAPPAAAAAAGGKRRRAPAAAVAPGRARVVPAGAACSVCGGACASAAHELVRLYEAAWPR